MPDRLPEVTNVFLVKTCCVSVLFCFQINFILFFSDLIKNLLKGR